MSSAGNAATTYGGDEINAIVLDPGSLNTRIGYAGDDYPKIITPSYYAINNEDSETSTKIFGDSINYPRSNYEVKPILKDSVIEDWDGALQQYHHYFDNVLSVEYPDQPILLTEPVWTSQEYRKKLVENVYESFNFPALYLAKAPTCVSFQQGRPNCLVVDIGHETVSVTPVIDGICLLKNSMRTHYSGKYLDDKIEDLIRHKFPEVKLENRFRIKTKVPTVYPSAADYTVKTSLPENITRSYEEYQKVSILHEFKETLLEVPEKKLNVNNPQQNQALKDYYAQEANKRLFEFPTGQSVEVSYERYQLADALFDPYNHRFNSAELNEKYPAENGELSIKGPYDDYRPLKRARKADSSASTPAPADEAELSGVRGLSQLISQTISAVDIDLRTSVAHNIIITGGTSLVPQLTDRLNAELANANPGLKIRIHAAGNPHERCNQTWVGGSVLASLGTFHQMWVSKAEYEEAGPDRILNQRFR